MLKKSKGWTKSKNVNSKRYKNDLANYLHERSIKCVTERIEGIEEVIGRSGVIMKRDDELVVYCGSETVLRTKIDDLYAWELLSLEGVVITAHDLEHGGAERTIIAFYTYWRPVESRGWKSVLTSVWRG